jgi:hypothetical protein
MPLFQQHRLSRRQALCLLLLCSSFLFVAESYGQGSADAWRVANDTELRAILPARAPVEKEHIETEMRTASGITNGHGKFIAGVVLITAGYSADGKYTHFFIAQVPLQVGAISLPPGEYVLGWQRGDATLNVHFYDAATGALRGSTDAKGIPGSTRVESFKVWPPQGKSLIQIGRFGIPFRLTR